MALQILNFTMVNADNFIASFDVYIEKQRMTIHNYRILRSKKGRIFVAPPAYPILEPDGTKKYRPVVEMPLDLQKRFDTEVRLALEPFYSLPSYEKNDLYR